MDTNDSSHHTLGNGMDIPQEICGDLTIEQEAASDIASEDEDDILEVIQQHQQEQADRAIAEAAAPTRRETVTQASLDTSKPEDADTNEAALKSPAAATIATPAVGIPAKPLAVDEHQHLDKIQPASQNIKLGTLSSSKRPTQMDSQDQQDLPPLEEPDGPGAYAVAPAGSGELEADPTSASSALNRPSCTSNNPWSNQSSDPFSSTGSSTLSDLDHAVVATMVEGPTSTLDLQQAEPIDLERATSASRATQQQQPKVFDPKRHAKLLALLTALLTGVLITVLAVFLPKASGNETQDTTASQGSTSAPSPEMNTLESTLLDALTLQDSNELGRLISLEDPDIPQAQAFQWMLQDPYLDDYLQDSSRLRQRFALASLYHSTNGEQWTYNTEWLSYEQHECFWWSKPDFAFKVAHFPALAYPENSQNPCDPETQSKYQHIWLWDNNLDGTLPEELYWLGDLQSISVFKNPLLTGTLSSQIGSLQQLQGITLAMASATGTIPTELGLLSDSMTYFSLFGDDIHGPIPSELGLLTKLQILTVDSNALTGTLPVELFEGATPLKWLYTKNNQLTGTIPSQIGNLSDLEHLELSHNQLTGSIPTQIGRLVSLMNIQSIGNGLAGRIPSEFGNAANLQVLEIPGNLLSGSIPLELGRLQPNLTHVLLQDNLLTGALPEELSSESLRLLNCTGNSLVLMDSSCWVQTDFFMSPECAKQHPPSSCRCQCSC